MERAHAVPVQTGVSRGESRHSAGETPLPAGVTPHKLLHTFASILVACAKTAAQIAAETGTPTGTVSSTLRTLTDDRLAVKATKGLPGQGELTCSRRNRLGPAASSRGPSWERATLSERMEENLREIAPDTFAKDPDDEEITGRLDIHYVTNGGRHVIVELKRFSVNDDVTKYATQGQKYYDALKSILEQQQVENPVIEVVFVLGKKPRVKSSGARTQDEFIAIEMSKCNGRFVLYDALISNAQAQYEEYLAASAKVTGLEDLLDSLNPLDENPEAVITEHAST